MKYEFIEFYPIVEKQKNTKIVGTCHIYLIDLELDFRGILVARSGKNFFYHMPHAWQYDPETKKKEKYPILRFTNQEKHQELLQFMIDEVSPIIRERLNPMKTKIA